MINVNKKHKEINNKVDKVRSLNMNKKKKPNKFNINLLVTSLFISLLLSINFIFSDSFI